MGRLSIPPLTEERKKQIDAGEIKLLKAQDAAYLLGIKPKTLREWVRCKPTLRNITGGNLSPKGEIYFLYDNLIAWTFSESREDMEITAEIARQRR